jgi:diadenosine tetraphosphatase ApaH/serine/threonine PP2A family protein phosphatase
MRVAVISDIHSNLVALEAVLGVIGGVDAIWHLGDTVGYGPEPQAVVDRLRRAGAIGVRGNHDDASGGGRSIEFFNPDAYRAEEWTRTQIDEPTRLFLAGLPERLVPTGSAFTLAHGSPRDPIWEYLDSTEVAAANLPAFDTPYCLVGHTHVPLVFLEMRGAMKRMVVHAGGRLTLDDRRLILNPGSVGQPRDRDPRASYLLIDTDAGHATWHRVEYDIAATQAAIAAAGLPPRLGRRLSVGQ